MPDVTFSIGGTSNAQPVISSTMEALMQMAEQSKVAAAQLAESFSKSSAMFAQQQEAIRNYASQLGMVGAKQEELATQTASAGPGGLLGALGGLWQGFQQGAGAVGGFAEKILGAINPLQLFHSNVMRLAEVMMLWRVFEYGTRMIQDFVGNIAQLPVTMERFEASWKYTFGMSDPRVTAMPSATPAEQAAQQAAAAGISRDLASWSARYSYNLPYTRQNMLQAISSLSMVNLSEEGIKHYLPIIADLASTAGVGFGGQPVNLATAAYAIQGAEMGYSRMLRYDLHINPEQLAQYGYDQSNPATLLPALEKYANATHRTGAAKDIARSTWFGASSSWEDRWQNFALDIGGYPAFGPEAGGLRKGSPFDVAREGLLSLNDFWDAHQSELNKLAAFLSQTLGQGLKDVGQDALAFAHGVQGSGLPRMISDLFQSFSHFLSDPTAQANIQGFFTGLGTAIGNLAADLQPKIDAITKAFSDIAKGWQELTQALTPTDQKDAKTLGDALGQFLDNFIKSAGATIRAREHDLALIFKLYSDVRNGDWGAAWQDLQQMGKDEGSYLWDILEPGHIGSSAMQQAQQQDQQQAILTAAQQRDRAIAFRDLMSQFQQQYPDMTAAERARMVRERQGGYTSGVIGPLDPSQMTSMGQNYVAVIGTSMFQGFTALMPQFAQHGKDLMNEITKAVDHDKTLIANAIANAILAGIQNASMNAQSQSYRANVRSPGGYNTFGGLGGIGLY